MKLSRHLQLIVEQEYNLTTPALSREIILFEYIALHDLYHHTKNRLNRLFITTLNRFDEPEGILCLFTVFHT